MIGDLPPITLTVRDHQRLMHTAERLAGQAHPLAAHLLYELRRATLCAPDQLPDVAAALDTFVTYRLVGEGTPEKRMLIHPDDRMWPPAELSVLTPAGLSLLGARAGNRMPLLGADGSADVSIEVGAVGPRVTGAFVPLGAPRPGLLNEEWPQCGFCSRARRDSRRSSGPCSRHTASSGSASPC